ncbi:MAG TPA: hypothetical protein VJ727_07610 [Rhodanobacteraceae bacterium]|nr:hypothetical protein [Rhodanobacteraceae bacterium]
MAKPKKPMSISEGLKRRTLYMPRTPRSEPTMYESELADQLANNAIRQLCIFQTEEGFSLKALPIWKDEFITLIGTATKEPRQYKSLDRLLRTIQQHGPLPPTLLLGTHK